MGNEDLTVFVGNLHEKVTEEILYELFLQAGPLAEVRIPSNNGVRKSFGFIQFKHEVSVPYSIYLLDDMKLYGRAIKLKSRSPSMNLFQPPPHIRIPSERYSFQGDTSSSLRVMGGGLNKRFPDRSMLPSGYSRSAKKSREEEYSPTEKSSLGVMGAHRRITDKSMLPRDSRKSQYKREESPPPDSWSPKHYPSQLEEPKGYERGLPEPPRHRGHHGRGISNHLSKPYHKTPYHNEKHHNRDKNRFDSHSSQRSKHHRPFTR